MIELRIANDDTSKKFINETIQNFHKYIGKSIVEAVNNSKDLLK